MPIYSIHQEKLFVLKDFFNESTTFFKGQPSPTSPSCVQPYLSQSDIAHRYALSLHDKQGSLPGGLHFGYHNLTLQLSI